MIPRVSKNKIRDLITDELDTGLCGTGTTSPLVTDTALETPDATTENSVTNTATNQTINTLYILYSNQGNNETYNEIGLKYNDGTLFSRVVFPDFNKTSGVELHTTILTRVR